MDLFKVEQISTKDVKTGDTVIFHGKVKTVCKKDIDKGFTGVTIFGDPLVLQDRKIMRFVVDECGRLVGDENGYPLR